MLIPDSRVGEWNLIRPCRCILLSLKTNELTENTYNNLSRKSYPIRFAWEQSLDDSSFNQDQDSNEKNWWSKHPHEANIKTIQLIPGEKRLNF